jgi:soluble P-type ATPase
MLKAQIPGREDLQLRHLVMDYNGTLACDGEILPGVKAALEALADTLTIHVVTADTFGKVQAEMKGYPCEIVILPSDNQDVGKLEYIECLGPKQTVCIGNGRNDRLMVKEAALGIALVQEEGAATETLLAADVVCRNIISALGLLGNPLRLKATLRS